MKVKNQKQLCCNIS